jgi:hypothetical protein
MAGGMSGLADEAEPRQTLEERRGDRGPRPNQDDAIGVPVALLERIEARDRIAVNIDIEVRQPRKALEVTDGVLILTLV